MIRKLGGEASVAQEATGTGVRTRFGRRMALAWRQGQAKSPVARRTEPQGSQALKAPIGLGRFS
jgi:hypothetical protein